MIKRLQSQKVSYCATLVWLTLLTAASTHAQTSAELRAKYGEPQTNRIKNGRIEVETYLVSPNMLLTVSYTKKGELCVGRIEPVKGTSPKNDKSEHPAQGDYMADADVIALINGLVPAERRGKLIGQGTMNDGHILKLNHPGCSGEYDAYYENATFYFATWCWGGVYSVTIVWGKSILKARSKLRCDGLGVITRKG